MPVAFDSAGMEQYDERTWFDPRTGDQVSLTYIGMVPDLPAGLDELPLLRHRLAMETAEVGALIEAHTVFIDQVPALFQLLKVPIPNQETGQAFIAAFTVPKATCSAVLRIQCAEGTTTGVREATVAGQVGPENYVRPHPYAPDLTGLLPWHVADEARWDANFPDHPLTRARAWAHHTIATARVDPAFARLAPFRPDQTETLPRQETVYTPAVGSADRAPSPTPPFTQERSAPVPPSPKPPSPTPPFTQERSAPVPPSPKPRQPAGSWTEPASAPPFGPPPSGTSGEDAETPVPDAPRSAPRPSADEPAPPDLRHRADTPRPAPADRPSQADQPDPIGSVPPADESHPAPADEPRPALRDVPSPAAAPPPALPGLEPADESNLGPADEPRRALRNVPPPANTPRPAPAGRTPAHESQPEPAVPPPPADEVRPAVPDLPPADLPPRAEAGAALPPSADQPRRAPADLDPRADQLRPALGDVPPPADAPRPAPADLGSRGDAPGPALADGSPVDQPHPEPVDLPPRADESRPPLLDGPPPADALRPALADLSPSAEQQPHPAPADLSPSGAQPRPAPADLPPPSGQPHQTLTGLSPSADQPRSASAGLPEPSDQHHPAPTGLSPSADQPHPAPADLAEPSDQPRPALLDMPPPGDQPRHAPADLPVPGGETHPAPADQPRPALVDLPRVDETPPALIDEAGSVPAGPPAPDDQSPGLAPLAALQSRTDAPEPTATEPASAPAGDPQVSAISEPDLSPPTDLRPPPTLGPPPDVPDPTSGPLADDLSSGHSIDSSSSGDSDEVGPTVEAEPSQGPARPTHAFSLPPLADELPPFQLPPRATLDSAAGPFRRSPLPPEPDSLELSPPPAEPPVRALHPVTNGLRAVPPLDGPAAVWQAPPADPVSPATNGSPAPKPRHASPAETTRTVLVGLPVGNYLSLWVNDELTYWRMADPDAVRARLGAGIEARSEVEDRRFRETALLDPDANTLFLADRFRDSTGRLGGPTTALEPATEDEARRGADDKAISALYHWLGEVALAAGERDELVAVEVGGWTTAAASPRVEVTLRTDGEEWHSVVEASPVPVDAPVWRDQQPVDGDTQLLVSPATDRTIRAAGLLTRFAVGTWSLHPFQLGLTFGPNPTLSETPTR